MSGWYNYFILPISSLYYNLLVIFSVLKFDSDFFNATDFHIESNSEIMQYIFFQLEFSMHYIYILKLYIAVHEILLNILKEVLESFLRVPTYYFGCAFPMQARYCDDKVCEFISF